MKEAEDIAKELLDRWDKKADHCKSSVGTNDGWELERLIIEALKEAHAAGRREVAENLADETEILKLAASGKSVDLVLKPVSQISERRGLILAGTLRENEAANYLEIKVTDTQTNEVYAITVQRVQGITPAQKAASEYERGRRDAIAEVVPTIDFYCGPWETTSFGVRMEGSNDKFERENERARALKEKLEK